MAQPVTTLAALLIDPDVAPEIDQIADSLLLSPIARDAATRSVTWDCDDLLFLDFNHLRVALQSVAATPTQPSYMCLAVGNQPGGAPMEADLCEDLAYELVHSLGKHTPISAVLWQMQDAALDAQAIDAFADTLEPMFNHLGEIQRDLHTSPAPQVQTGQALPPAENFAQDDAIQSLVDELYSALDADTAARAAAMRTVQQRSQGVMRRAHDWISGLDKHGSTA